MAGSALEVEGLQSAFQALVAFGNDSSKDSTAIIRKRVRPIVTAARRVDSGARSQPSSSNWITFKIVSAGAVIEGTGARAKATEFGLNVLKVFGRGFPQKKIKSGRTYNDWGTTGYVVWPTVNSMIKKVTKQIADDMLKEASKELDKRGVKRG